MSHLTEVKLPSFPLEEMYINGRMSSNWHRWFSMVIDAVPKMVPFTFTKDPGNILANSSNNETVTVTGLRTTDVVIVNKPTYLAGVIIDARVTAADTLSITFANVTTGAINPGSEVYTGYAIRR